MWSLSHEERDWIRLSGMGDIDRYAIKWCIRSSNTMGPNTYKSPSSLLCLARDAGSDHLCQFSI